MCPAAPGCALYSTAVVPCIPPGMPYGCTAGVPGKAQLMCHCQQPQSSSRVDIIAPRRLLPESESQTFCEVAYNTSSFCLSQNRFVYPMPCCAAEEVMQLLAKGAVNRHVAATKANTDSSRSHCVFSCVLESRCTEEGVTSTRTSCLKLVDLAGLYTSVPHPMNRSCGYVGCPSVLLCLHVQFHQLSLCMNFLHTMRLCPFLPACGACSDDTNTTTQKKNHHD